MIHYHAVISFVGFEPMSRFLIAPTGYSAAMDLADCILVESNKIMNEHAKDKTKPIAILISVSLTIIQ